MRRLPKWTPQLVDKPHRTLIGWETHKPMQTPKDIKRNLRRQEGVHNTADCDPDRPEDEDEALSVDIGDAAPKKQEAAKGQDIRRYNPLLAGIGDIKFMTYMGQDDDNSLAREGLGRCNYCQLSSEETDTTGSRLGKIGRISEALTFRNEAPVKVTTKAMQRPFERVSSTLASTEPALLLSSWSPASQPRAETCVGFTPADPADTASSLSSTFSFCTVVETERNELVLTAFGVASETPTFSVGVITANAAGEQ